jgi:hypothetical protein
MRFVWDHRGFYSSYFRNLFDYYRFRSLFRESRSACRRAYLDIEYDSGKGLFSLVWFLSQGGYEVHMKHRPRFVANVGEYSRLILCMPSVVLTGQAPTMVKPHLFFSDHQGEPHAGCRSIRLGYDLFHAENQTCMRLPLGLHPYIYQRGVYARVKEFADNDERPLVGFFAGRMVEDAYNNSVIREMFGKLTRFEFFDALRPLVEDGRCLYPESKAEIREGGQDKLVVWDGSDEKIKLEEYMKLLSRSRFALCPAGTHFPHCHNSIEAMSMGAIPILEHPEMFYPGLEDGKNCLAFEGRTGLFEKVQTALEMPERLVKEMRANVLRYYAANLAPESIVERIENNQEIRCVNVNAEGKSIHEMRRRLQSE